MCERPPTASDGLHRPSRGHRERDVVSSGSDGRASRQSHNSHAASPNSRPAPAPAGTALSTATFGCTFVLRGLSCSCLARLTRGRAREWCLESLEVGILARCLRRGGRDDCRACLDSGRLLRLSGRSAGDATDCRGRDLLGRRMRSLARRQAAPSVERRGDGFGGPPPACVVDLDLSTRRHRDASLDLASGLWRSRSGTEDSGARQPLESLPPGSPGGRRLRAGPRRVLPARCVGVPKPQDGNTAEGSLPSRAPGPEGRAACRQVVALGVARRGSVLGCPRSVPLGPPLHRWRAASLGGMGDLLRLGARACGSAGRNRDDTWCASSQTPIAGCGAARGRKT